jgi:uncharacterized integral membrane protein (TIGR00698 family)
MQTGQRESPAEGRRGITEDWLAIGLGAAVLGLVFVGLTVFDVPADAIKQWLGKPADWTDRPWESLGQWRAIVGALVAVSVIASVGAISLGRARRGFAAGLVVVLALSTIAYVLSGQSTINNLSLEYALWALVVGLLISNTVGTPAWLGSAAMTEFYIKTGLVIYGAEILFGELLALGLPGICVAWIVTPVVLITTFWFGQKVLKIESATLNMVISADMSVCGVSAAIATSAACRAKKEELSLAIGMSLCFTVIMMVVLPKLISWMGLSSMVGGAWLGGTIDSTGAVAAAGAMLDETAAKVAITVKMIQNILIGVVAFGVAVYWVRFQQDDADSTGARPAVGIGEIWRRFPRFILGFLVASVLFSILAQSDAGAALAKSTTGLSKVIRGWLFCMAFVSIGLETNFFQLARVMKNGRPLVLYICGQTLNLTLTLLMAWLVFEKLFPVISQQVTE